MLMLLAFGVLSISQKVSLSWLLQLAANYRMPLVLSLSQSTVCMLQKSTEEIFLKIIHLLS